MADDKAQNEQPRPRGGDSDSGAKPSAETAKPKVGDSRPAPKIGDSRPAPQSADGAKTDGNGNQNRQSGGNPAGDGQPRKRCLLYTSPSPRDATLSRMPSSA